MQLKCRINEIEYNTNLVQGATFSDEYNETLDSGTIIISNVNKITDLKPYTDVYIYTGNYTGYQPPVYEVNEKKFEVESSVESKSSYYVFRTKTIKIHKNILNGRDATLILYFFNLDGKTYKSAYGVKDNGDNTISLVYKWGKTGFPLLTLNLSGDYYTISQRFSILSYGFLLYNIESYYYQDVETNIPGVNTNPNKTFYKHLLVNSFNEEYVNLTGDTQKTNGIYKYTIELFSETKGLETVQLPNISVTQPLNMYGKDSNGNRIKLKKTVWEYLYSFVNMYSPKIRVVSNSNQKTWKYVNKYVIDYSLKSVFDKVYCPDFSLNNPNLRDVLSKLMVVKDYIPYVEDDVIKGLDITQRRGTFNVDLGSINYVSATMSSGDYASNLRRGYSEALSQDNSAKMVEYLGFRNSDNALMTIENMRLETRFPIYKINKIYLCYYKKGKMVNFKPESTSNDVDISGNEIYGSDNNKLGDVTGECVFLCKQDITKLVKLDSERNLLSQDWSTLKNATTVDELAKYKIATVGYSIGSKYITGWGQRFDYPTDNTYWFKKEKTYLQKLAEFMDGKYPYGIYNNAYFTDSLGDGNYFLLPKNSDILSNIETIFDTSNWLNYVVDFFSGEHDGASSAALRLKSFFFEVDYQAFYNGAVVHSKDGASDEVTINDNSSSSLTLLEQDGLFQKEKINRFGNKNITIPARYKYYYDENNNLITPISQLQPLGSVYERDDEEDVIIYHREYQIFENEIKCTYVGSKDYVLKNYYTTVYAKHRTYNLMSYGESVRRSENKKTTLLLSKNSAYYDDDENRGLSFSNFSDNYVCLLFSAFKPDWEPSYKDDFVKNDIINYAYIEFKDRKYLSDLNAFVSGNSMCFNLTMFDNVSMGVFVSDPEPEYEFDVKQDYVGSIQSWAMTVDNYESGHAKKMGFYVSHINKKEYFSDKPQAKSSFNTDDVYYKLLNMPIIIDDVEETNKIHVDNFVLKDNKEVIDMTFQIEPISENSDIIFSNWLMKLSSLMSTKNKIGRNWEIKDYDVPIVTFDIRVGYAGYPARQLLGQSFPKTVSPFIFFKISSSDLSRLSAGQSCNTNLLEFECSIPGFDLGIQSRYKPIRILIKEIKSISSDEIVFIAKIQERKVWKKALWEDSQSSEGDKELKFVKIHTDNNGDYYFSCAYVSLTAVMYYSAEAIDYLSIWSDLIYPEDMFFDLTSYVTGSAQGIVIDNSFIESIRTQNTTLSVYDSNFTYILKTYYKNMWVVLDKSKMEKTIVYDELVYSDFGTTIGSQKWRTNYNVENYFGFNTSGIIPKIRVKLINSWKSYGYKSIQYWYLDRENESDNDIYNGSYKFVFGVNISDEDYERGYIDIYISDISNKNKNVYNENRIKIGTLYDFGQNPWGLVDTANIYYDNSSFGIIVEANDLISHMKYEYNHNFRITTISYCEIAFTCYYRITTSLNEVITTSNVTFRYGIQTETTFNSPNDTNITKVEILNTNDVVLKTYNNVALQGSDFEVSIFTNSGLYIANNSNVSSDFYTIVRNYTNSISNTPYPVYIQSGERSDFIPITEDDANYAKVYLYDFFDNLIDTETVSLDDVIIPIVTIANVSTVDGITYVLNIKNENAFAVNMAQKVGGVLSTETIAAGGSATVNVTFYSDGDINVYFQFDDFNGNYSQVWYGLLDRNHSFETINVSSISRLDGVNPDDIICYANFDNSKILIYNNTTSNITISRIYLKDGNDSGIRYYDNVTLYNQRVYSLNSNNDNISSLESIKLEFYLENNSTISFTKICNPTNEDIIRQYDNTNKAVFGVSGTYSNGNFNLYIVNTGMYDANIGEISVGILNGGGVSGGSQYDIFIAKQGGTYTHSYSASPASGNPIFTVKIYDYWGNLIKSQNFNA